MRNKWYLVLCLLMLALSPALALAAPSITISTVAGTAGQGAKVDLTLANDGAAQISTIIMEIGFDPTKVSANPTTVVGAASTAAGKSLSSSVSNVNANLSTVNISISGGDSTIANGVLASITLPLLATLNGATVPVTFNAVPVASNPDALRVTVTTVNGAVTVADTQAPTVTGFTVPATATSPTNVPVSIAATDNVGVTAYLITQSQTKPTATAAGWSTSPITSYTFTGTFPPGVPTNATAFAWVKDASGNVSNFVSGTTNKTISITALDTIAPVVSAFTIPATATGKTISPVGITATDNVTGGTISYLITEATGGATPSKPAASDAGWSTTKPTSYSIAATLPEGTTAVTLAVWAKDAAGNVSNLSAGTTSKTVNVTIADATPPVVSAVTVPGTSTSRTITPISFTATDAVGVTGYLITETNVKPAANAAGWSATKPTSYTLASATATPEATATNVTLFVWAKDAQGNVSVAGAGTSAQTVVTVPDLTAPVVTGFTVPATGISPVVNVTVTATDFVGVTGYLVTQGTTKPAANDPNWSATAPTSVTVTGLQQNVATPVTLSAWAKDAAGNVSSLVAGTTSKSITITLTGPTLTIDPAVLASGTATNKNTVTLKGTVTANSGSLTAFTLTQNAGTPVDLLAGVNPQTGAFNTAVTLTNGENTLLLTATDGAGSSTNSRTITFDPELAELSVTAPADQSFTKNTFVTVTGKIGAPETTTVQVALNGGTPQTVAVTGNDFSTQVSGLTLGANTIVITATDSAAPAPGVNTTTLTVTSDTVAPSLAVTAPAADISTPKATVTLNGTLTDTTSNPTINVKVNNVALTTQPTLAQDGSFNTSIDLPAIGSYAIVVSSTDEAGNTSSITRNVNRVYPTGNVTDGVAAPSITDAQAVAKHIFGIAPLSADQQIFVNVGPLDATTHKPSPDADIDISDIQLILERIVGTVTW